MRFILIYCCACALFTHCDTNSAPSRSLHHAQAPVKHQPVLQSAPAEASYNLQEYIRWVKDPASGLVVMQEKSGYVFELSYRPALLEALSGLSGGEKLNDKKLDGLTKDYKGLQYYHFRIYEDGLKLSDLKFKEQGQVTISEYFAYSAEKHFGLIEGKDTLAPVLYHFENTYPHVPYLSFVLAFKDEQQHVAAGNRTLVLNNLLLPGDAVALPVSNEAIINQPNPKNINQVWQ
jgi:hypothetical protein